MELRSYEELKLWIDQFYANYSDSQLRGWWRDENLPRPSIRHPYCLDNEVFQHILQITIPGKKTFEKFIDGVRVESDKKESNDIKIALMQGNRPKLIKHEDIINDLYDKLSKIEDQNLRMDYYIYYKNLLRLLYRDSSLSKQDMEIYFFHNPIKGYKIPTLVSFIRWCSVQEMINYPYGWGKDLCFARYFEALWAGFSLDENMKIKTIERAKSRTRPLPLSTILVEHNINWDIYWGLLTNRMYD